MDARNEWGGGDIAEQIRRALSAALDKEDFGQLNRSISETVDSALGEARQQFERYRNRAVRGAEEPVDSQNANWVPEEADSFGGGTGTGGTEDWKRGTRPPGDDGRMDYGNGIGAGGRSIFGSEPYSYGGQQEPQLPDYRVKWYGRVSGILMSAFGALGTSVFGLLTFLLMTISLIVIDGAGGWIVTLLLALVTGGFGLMLWGGISRFGRVSRLKQYLDEIRRSGKAYCEVARLGHAAGRSESFARKDLKKILSLGMLPDAKMDEKGTYLMMDAETYRQYEMSQMAFRARQEEERRAKEETAEEAFQAQTGGVESSDPENAAVEAAITRGREQMEKLDGIRRSLPAGTMTDKLIRLDQVLGRLFETLRKYPDQLDELERFINGPEATAGST